MLYTIIKEKKKTFAKSESENRKFKELVELHPECVEKDKTHIRNWGTLAWLGTNRIKDQWYHEKDLVVAQPIQFPKMKIMPLTGQNLS